MDLEWFLLLYGPMYLLAAVFRSPALLASVLAIIAFLIMVFFHELVFRKSFRWRTTKAICAMLVTLVVLYLALGC